MAYASATKPGESPMARYEEFGQRLVYALGLALVSIGGLLIILGVVFAFFEDIGKSENNALIGFMVAVTGSIMTLVGALFVNGQFYEWFQDDQ